MAKYNRSEYIAKQEQEKERLEQLVKDLANKYEHNSKDLIEALQFGSRFHQYSARNTTLIRAQNRYATYTASYKNFEKMGYNVNRGEHGLKILVPVKATYLSIKDEWIKLSEASKKQKEDFKKGKLKSKTVQRYKVGTVFDISQTNCPVSDYPKLYDMGYESKPHAQLYIAVKEYCETALSCPVKEQDVKSIRLSGYYIPENHEIYLNEKLNDTEKLSTLLHELGHAQLHKNKSPKSLPLHQTEFEADALSIMLQTKIGIPITESRQRHLSDHFNQFNDLIKAQEENIQLYTEKQYLEAKNKLPSVTKVLDNVSNYYKNMVTDFSNILNHSLHQQQSEVKQCQQQSNSPEHIQPHHVDLPVMDNMEMTM